MNKHERMVWWREARFGMFIHWGLYAIPAGIWKGKEYPSIGEWIMRLACIPAKEYEQLANKFNPIKFDADAWVRIAKNAGMKYLVITAKHHDGFAMFHSPSNKYNIVNTTPYGRDPMKDLAIACRKAGIKLCFYYSHVQDWHDPDAVGNDWDYPVEHKKNFARYLREKAKPQLRELLTQYGPVGLIWFDTPYKITKSQSLELKQFVRHLQPKCIVSGRIGHNLGDYGSLDDNEFPSRTVKGDWETPATMNDTWGFKTRDHNWKSVKTLLHLLANSASKGANYLLNVGPTAEGIIPQASVSRLEKIGEWLRVNGEAIYGTQAGPYDCQFNWGWITQKEGKLYLLFSKWPQQGRIMLFGLRNKVRKAYPLNDRNKNIDFKQTYNQEKKHSDVELFLPRIKRTNPYIEVVVLDIDGKAAVTQKQIMRISVNTILGSDNSYRGEMVIYNPCVSVLHEKLRIESAPDVQIEVNNEILIQPGQSVTLPFNVKAITPFEGKRSVRFSLCRDGLQVAEEVQFIHRKDKDIKKVVRPIHLNGDLQDWEGISGEKVATREHVTYSNPADSNKGWQGPHDLSFIARNAWDEKGLYFRIDVTDDMLTLPPVECQNTDYAWRYDCVEIFLGATASKIEDLSKAIFKLFVIPPITEKTSRCKTIIVLDKGMKMEVHFVGRRTAKGYMVEGRITPTSGAVIKLQSGQLFTHEIVIHDADHDAGEGSLRTGMALNSKCGAYGCTNTNDPENWRWMSLSE